MIATAQEHQWGIDAETGREACDFCGGLRGRAPDGQFCKGGAMTQKDETSAGPTTERWTVVLDAQASLVAVWKGWLLRAGLKQGWRAVFVEAGTRREAITKAKEQEARK